MIKDSDGIQEFAFAPASGSRFSGNVPGCPSEYKSETSVFAQMELPLAVTIVDCDGNEFNSSINSFAGSFDSARPQAPEQREQFQNDGGRGFPQGGEFPTPGQFPGQGEFPNQGQFPPPNQFPGQNMPGQGTFPGFGNFPPRDGEAGGEFQRQFEDRAQQQFEQEVQNQVQQEFQRQFELQSGQPGVAPMSPIPPMIPENFMPPVGSFMPPSGDFSQPPEGNFLPPPPTDSFIPSSGSLEQPPPVMDATQTLPPPSDTFVSPPPTGDTTQPPPPPPHRSAEFRIFSRTFSPYLTPRFADAFLDARI